MAASTLALWAATLLAAAPAAAAGPGKAAPAAAAQAPKAKAKAPAAHPDTMGEQECANCHQDLTPAVYKAWEGSRHGLALVKCVTCHGSPGGAFVRRAAAERCRGCHGAQVDSVKALGLKDCFACHAPHTLSPSPHRAEGRK